MSGAVTVHLKTHLWSALVSQRYCVQAMALSLGRVLEQSEPHCSLGMCHADSPTVRGDRWMRLPWPVFNTLGAPGQAHLVLNATCMHRLVVPGSESKAVIVCGTAVALRAW